MSGPRYTASSSQDPAPSVPFVLPDGSEIALQITTDSSTGKEKVHCDLCHNPISLGPHRSLRYLSQHRGFQACRQALQRWMVRDTRLALQSGKERSDRYFNLWA
jgi:hypothetical protein